MTQVNRQDLLQQQALPNTYLEVIERFLCPLANSLYYEYEHQSLPTLIVGIQGCQGSGKSTCSLFLKHILESEYDCPTAILSLDDFYYSHATRQSLAKSVHPLLATRGVPGSHDIGLAKSTLNQILNLGVNQSMKVPLFDKSEDDVISKNKWRSIRGPVNIILFEGWCVGLTEQPKGALSNPINEFERLEDSGGRWRTYVNEQLAGEYQLLYSYLDKLIVLQAPSFDSAYQWRLLQEDKLKSNVMDITGSQVMNRNQLRRFVDHFQRLTQHGLNTMPEQADWVLNLREDHSVSHLMSNL